MNVGVVGGGLAGLATASALHAAGHAVTVYEAAAQIGGRMGTVTMEDHPVDVGFHVLPVDALVLMYIVLRARFPSTQ